MRRLSKRWLSLFLALVLTLGMVTLPASADDQEETADGTVVSLTEEETAGAETTEEEAESAGDSAEEVSSEETESEGTAAEEAAADAETLGEETEETGTAEAAEAAEGSETAEEEDDSDDLETAAGSGYVSTWYENGLADGLYASPILAELAGIKFQNEKIADILNMSQDPALEDFSFSTFFANTVFADLTYEDLLAYCEAGYEDMTEVLAAMTSTSGRRRASSSTLFQSSYTLTCTASTVPSVYMSVYNSYHGRLWYLTLGGHYVYCLDYGYGASTGTTYSLIDESSKLTDDQIYDIKTGILFTLLMLNGGGDRSQGWYQGTMSDIDSDSNAIYYMIIQVWVWGILAGHSTYECADDIYEVWANTIGDADSGTSIRNAALVFLNNNFQDNYDMDAFEIAVYSSGDSTDQMLLMYDFSTLVRTSGQIALTKSGANTNSANVSGAVYTVYSDSDCTDAVATITTNSSGYGISNEFELDASVDYYYIKETTAPAGTFLSSTVYKVLRTDLQTAAVNDTCITLNDSYGDIENEQYYGQFFVKKTDEDTGEILEGAVFAIYYGDDYSTFLEYMTYNEDEQYYESSMMYYTVNNNGNFRIVEVSAPEGYENSGWYVDVTLTESTQVYSYAVTNKASTGGVSIQKVDADTVTAAAQGNATLAGAVYVIVDAETGEEVTRITTDETGYAATGTDDLTFGDYILYEVEASTGYTVDDTQIAFTVDTAHTIVALTDETGEEATSKEAVIRGGVIIQKGDYQTGAAVLLAGTEFTIYNSSDAEVVVDGVSYEPGEAVLVLTTNGAGLAYTDSDALPYGSYTIVETKAPTGYNLFGITTLTFDITEDREMVDLTGTDGILDLIIRGDFEFSKKDFETQAEMAGVSFLITSDTTGESHVVTTDENGYYSSSSDYVLHSCNTNAGTAGSGLWFGYNSQGNWADVDDTLGALPYGTYTIVELAGDNNENQKLVSGTITITKDGYTVDLGTIQNKTISITTTAVAEGTNSHYTYADDNVTIIDTVSYYNTYTDEEQVIIGVLVNAETGEVVTDADGSAITSEYYFTPTTESGSVEIQYTFDASDLAGADVVVYEYLYLVTDNGNELIASHADITDEGQTIHFPGITTEALDSETEDHVSLADEEVVITETISYSNLEAGKKYTLTASLYNAETGEILVVNGKEVTQTTTFTPEESDGTVELTFTLDASDLAGTTVVIFEELSRNNTLYAAEQDLAEAEQTVYIPAIGTTALDSETGIQNSLADEEVTIIDTVAYDHVLPGVEYTVSGILYDQSTGEPLLVDGEEVTGSTTFTAESTSGTVEVTYTFDGTGLEDTTLVVFETLYYGENPVAVHEDIEDEEQTIYIPELGTEALNDATGTHNALAEGTVTIIDTVAYTNLLAGREYTVSGILYDKSTGEPLLVDGEEVTAAATFTAESTAGTVQLTYTFDASGLAGTAIVVFEEMYYEGILIACHADLTDADQTIDFPEMETSAADGDDGDKNAYADSEVIIVDTVTYTGLTVGETYTVSGVLMDKSTGEAFADADGNTVTASTTFTAEASSGSVEVMFVFDGTELAGTSVVVFEQLLDANGEMIGVHEDISDEDQTVTLIEVVTEEEAVRTGDGSGLVLWMASAAVALGIAAVFVLVRRKKERER